MTKNRRGITMALTVAYRAAYERVPEATLAELVARRGPRGGHNAANIDGWVKSPSRAHTVAIRQAHVPHKMFYTRSGNSGNAHSYPAVPAIVLKEVERIMKRAGYA